MFSTELPATWDVCEINGSEKGPQGVLLVLQTVDLRPDRGHHERGAPAYVQLNQAVDIALALVSEGDEVRLVKVDQVILFFIAHPH